MKKVITPEEAFFRLQRYCAFQERSAFNVLTKLRSLEITGDMAEQILQTLREEGYLDEERFARTFARSKFRQNEWGRVRIRLELRKHRVPGELIDTALEEIDETEYRETLRKLLLRKRSSLAPDDPHIQEKTMQYCLQKGFEPEEIRESWKLEDGSREI